MPKNEIRRRGDARQQVGRASGMTIGRLAAAADVGVETIRYYQRRQLLPVPAKSGVRRYSTDILERIQFIKRSQALGFTLEEVRELLRLEDGGTRVQVRRIASARLAGVREKITALLAIEHVLALLLEQCESTTTQRPCPIIAALTSRAEATA